MAAQSNIAAKTAITAIALTGTALTIGPRGKDSAGVLLWVAPGATALSDKRVDFSYRNPSSKIRKAKGLVRVFCPKTAVNSTTGITEKVGDNVANLALDLLDSATAAERQELIDILTSTITSLEFRDAFINGNVMY